MSEKARGHCIEIGIVQNGKSAEIASKKYSSGRSKFSQMAKIGS